MDALKANTLKKWAVIIVLDLIFLITIVLFVGYIQPFSHTNIKIDGVFIDPPREVIDFTLINQHGDSFTKSKLKGRWTILFFGFTHCTMVCPTTFDALNKMYFLLEKELPTHLLPQVIFISIDPENDTVERLNQYVSSYNSHFIGARADISKTTLLEKKLSISEGNISGTNNHTTDILLINPQAQIQAYFLYPHRPENMARDYQKIVNAYSIPAHAL
jgi:protein SCO1